MNPKHTPAVTALAFLAASFLPGCGRQEANNDASPRDGKAAPTLDLSRSPLITDAFELHTLSSSSQKLIKDLVSVLGTKGLDFCETSDLGFANSGLTLKFKSGIYTVVHTRQPAADGPMVGSVLVSTDEKSWAKIENIPASLLKAIDKAVEEYWNTHTPDQSKKSAPVEELNAALKDAKGWTLISSDPATIFQKTLSSEERLLACLEKGPIIANEPVKRYTVYIDRDGVRTKLAAGKDAEELFQKIQETSKR